MALWHFSLLFLFSCSLGVQSARFTLQNNCQNTIWAGTLSGSGKPFLMNGGLELNSNEGVPVDAPAAWSGRFWGRTKCTFDASGKGSCATGDCGGVLQCNGAGGAPPVSLAEFTLDSPVDFYDVSLVDGYNLPISITPSVNNCIEVKCTSGLNQICPKELQLESNGVVIGCKSACLAFNKPEYCCSGEYNNPNICKPTNYSQVFKTACPKAYSYPYDDATSTFTCKGADYTITFC
ncbi:OLC1v1001584C1 [Oldenlandia corymbosa var. corymbosa]|uniref:OLC1v1001584C1 n=1 Tax=Oldenlandia corymbosa var. corymbosa TaxID=529605 RepID=A0AAV1D7W3_OLDCO|nr:OLC1v1001584C1 [Oldenlandia corymbosa var. corymbosa]